MRFGMFYVLESPDGDFTAGLHGDARPDRVRRGARLRLGLARRAPRIGVRQHAVAAVAASAIADVTERLRIGIAVSILPFGNPVRIAEDYAMVDVISDGRLDMGVGRGYQPREFAMLGLADQQEHSRAIFSESLDMLIGLWENDDVLLPRRALPDRRRHALAEAGAEATAADLRRRDQPRVVRPRREVRPQHHGHADPDVAAGTEGERHRGEEAADQGRPRTRVAELPDELADAPGADTREEAEQRPADALDWYFNLVMELVPKGPNAPKGYEFMRDLAAAFEAGRAECRSRRCRRPGSSCSSDPAGTADKIREVRDDIGQQEVFCWMRIGGLVRREGPRLDEVVRRGGDARVPGRGPGRSRGPREGDAVCRYRARRRRRLSLQSHTIKH